MRPAGDVRRALLRSASAPAARGRGATLAELAAHANVGYAAARYTVSRLKTAGALQVARTRAVPQRRRPVAEYAPARPAHASRPHAALAGVCAAWVQG